MKWHLRRRAWRQVSKFSPEDSAFMVHVIVQFEMNVEPTLVSMLAERAAEGAGEAGRSILLKIAEAYRVGRQVKFGTYPAEFRTVMVPRELEDAVEEALMQGDSNA